MMDRTSFEQKLGMMRDEHLHVRAVLHSNPVTYHSTTLQQWPFQALLNEPLGDMHINRCKDIVKDQVSSAAIYRTSEARSQRNGMDIHSRHASFLSSTERNALYANLGVLAVSSSLWM